MPRGRAGSVLATAVLTTFALVACTTSTDEAAAGGSGRADEPTTAVDCSSSGEHFGPDPIDSEFAAAVLGPAPEPNDREMPDDVPDDASFTWATVAWDEVVRPSNELPEIGSVSGSVDVLADPSNLDEAALAAAEGTDLLMVVGAGAGPEQRVLHEVVALRDDGSIAFLGPCQDWQEEAARALADDLGRTPADIVRTRAADPAAFAVLLAERAPRTTTWDEAPPDSRQVTANPPILAGMESVGIHVVAPLEWLTDEGPGALCTLTSVGMGDCARLNTALGGVFDIGAYARRGTVEDVRVVFVSDGGDPGPREVAVVPGRGFPGPGAVVELDGSLDDPTATVTLGPAVPDHPLRTAPAGPPGVILGPAQPPTGPTSIITSPTATPTTVG